MSAESRVESNKALVFELCEEMGEAAVLADLERAGATFKSDEQQWQAWEWVYSQRIKREQDSADSLKATARWTLWAALGIFLVALFGVLAWLALFSRHQQGIPGLG